MREYIDQRVTGFADKNPEVALYVRHRPSRHPRLVAEYLNGKSKIVCVKNLTPEEIQKFVTQLRTESGAKAEKLKKPWHTERPSIQGNWNPFLNH
jgi:large subunit ribosomal protein L43